MKCIQLWRSTGSFQSIHYIFCHIFFILLNSWTVSSLCVVDLCMLARSHKASWVEVERFHCLNTGWKWHKVTVWYRPRLSARNVNWICKLARWITGYRQALPNPGFTFFSSQLLWKRTSLCSFLWKRTSLCSFLWKRTSLCSFLWKRTSLCSFLWKRTSLCFFLWKRTSLCSGVIFYLTLSLVLNLLDSKHVATYH